MGRATLGSTRPSSNLRRSTRIKDAQASTAVAAKVEETQRVSKAKPKPKPVRYDCTTCDRNLAASMFPKYLPTDNCEHLINTCKACLKDWISMSLANNTYDKITCPQCPQLIQNSDMKTHALKKDYERFDELERRGIAEKNPGWRWCLAPKCKAGQVHKPLLESDLLDTIPTPAPRKSKRATRMTTLENHIDISPTPKSRKSKHTAKMVVPIENICTCRQCGAKACVICDRPYHEGETCEGYQRRVKNEEDEKTAKFIEKECKQCPKCKKNIEKNGGCDHMFCTQCRTQFCWHCLVTYDIINKSGHGQGCMYAQTGRIDPHAANVLNLFNGGGFGIQNGNQGGNQGVNQGAFIGMGAWGGGAIAAGWNAIAGGGVAPALGGAN